MRLLARDELFLETRGHTDDPVPFFNRLARHYVENNIAFMLTDFTGITVKHQYGSLPPAYKFMDHRVSVELTFQAKQK